MKLNWFAVVIWGLNYLKCSMINNSNHLPKIRFTIWISNHILKIWFESWITNYEPKTWLRRYKMPTLTHIQGVPLWNVMQFQHTWCPKMANYTYGVPEWWGKFLDSRGLIYMVSSHILRKFSNVLIFLVNLNENCRPFLVSWWGVLV